MPRARTTKAGGPGAAGIKCSIPAAAPAQVPSDVRFPAMDVVDLMNLVAPKKIKIQQMEEEQAVNELAATQTELRRKQVRAAVIRYPDRRPSRIGARGESSLCLGRPAHQLLRKLPAEKEGGRALNQTRDSGPNLPWYEPWRFSHRPGANIAARVSQPPCVALVRRRRAPRLFRFS
jgi:hypothetical protein